MDRSVLGVEERLQNGSRPLKRQTGPEARWEVHRNGVHRGVSPNPTAVGPERVGHREVADADPEAVRVADREEVRDVDQGVARDGPAEASGAAREAVQDAEREEAPGDARVDRNVDFHAEALARRGAGRSRYGQVRCYPGCCRRGNSRTNLQ